MANVLIIESRPHLADLASLVVARLGHEVAVVPDIRTARQALRSLRFDLVLTDFTATEVLEGRLMLEAIRQADDSNGPQLVLFPNRERGDAETGDWIRANAVPVRPYQSSELVGAIGASLAKCS